MCEQKLVAQVATFELLHFKHTNYLYCYYQLLKNIHSTSCDNVTTIS